jgi:vacuolar protein sorting-associated protein IST1
MVDIHVAELQILRDILMHKYGREFSAGVMENKDNCVSERVSSYATTEISPSSLPRVKRSPFG